VNESPQPTSFLVDLVAACRQATASGPQWSFESTDLDLTVLTWTACQEIAPHVNNEVDVVLIGLDGIGEVRIDEAVYRLTAGQAVLIAKGARRSLHSLSDKWSYLSVHRRRRGLWPTFPTDVDRPHENHADQTKGM
jgi:mannose-6-phosphate isomerase-like protein (cupin superfamily)